MSEEQSYQSDELLNRVADGEESAFRELVLQYSGLLYTYIYKHIESREATEELVQDVFFQIWNTRESLRDIRNFRTYLYVVSRNQAVNALKKMAREYQLLRQYSQQETVTSPEENILVREMQLSAIEEAIENLPPQQKKAWILSRRQKLTYQEVASEMGISRETVKTYLQHAHSFIAKYLVDRMSAMLLFIWMK